MSGQGGVHVRLKRSELGLDNMSRLMEVLPLWYILNFHHTPICSQKNLRSILTAMGLASSCLSTSSRGLFRCLTSLYITVFPVVRILSQYSIMCYARTSWPCFRPWCTRRLPELCDKKVESLASLKTFHCISKILPARPYSAGGPTVSPASPPPNCIDCAHVSVHESNVRLEFEVSTPLGFGFGS